MTNHSELITGLEFLATFGGEHGKRYADAAAALRELSKDAERWRYFRAFKIMPIDIEVECRKRGISEITPSLLDEIIDAAMISP